MKKLIVSLLCLTFLCSCSDKDESSVPVKHFKDETPSASDGSIQGSSQNQTSEEKKNGLTYNIWENSVELHIEGKSVQTIQLGYTPGEYDIASGDYDFDGFEDFRVSEPGTRLWEYYHYNSETGQFNEWSALNEVNAPLQVYSDDTLVSYFTDDCSLYSHHTLYKWNEDKLSPTEFVHFYYNSYNNSEGVTTTTDTYTFSENGEKVLSKREISDLQGNMTETLSADSVYYFSMHENGIDVLSNGEILQTLDEKHLEEYNNNLAARIEISAEYQNVEELLVSNDFDFDGNPDLFVPELFGRSNLPGTYYRYNPETKLFEKWDELNEIGVLAEVDYSEKTLTAEISISAAEHKKIVYKWQDGKCTPVLCKHRYAVKEDEAYIDTFDYSSGEETLIKRERVLFDENMNMTGVEEVDF